LIEVTHLISFKTILLHHSATYGTLKPMLFIWAFLLFHTERRTQKRLIWRPREQTRW